VSPEPILAVVTDTVDAVAVAGTAARLADRRGAPLVLAVPLPWPARPADARAIVGRVRPTLDLLGVPYTVAVAPYVASSRRPQARNGPMAAVHAVATRYGVRTWVTTDDLEPRGRWRPDRVDLVVLDRTAPPPAGPWGTPLSDPTRVLPGRLVHVEFSDGRREQVRLLSPVEAPLDHRGLSWESPLARALLGARVGESVIVRTPEAGYAARVVDIGDDG